MPNIQTRIKSLISFQINLLHPRFVLLPHLGCVLYRNLGSELLKDPVDKSYFPLKCFSAPSSDMFATCTRINPSEWNFFTDKIEGRRRAGPRNDNHPVASNKNIAALAVLAFVLLVATEKVEAAPYSRDYSYGFSESISIIV